MKKIIYLITLLVLFFTIPGIAQEIDLEQRKAKLIGAWEIAESRYLIIKENNELALEEEEEIAKTGAWKLSDDGKTFYILEDEEIVEEMPIVEVSETTFTFMTGNSEMVLTRRESVAAQAPLNDEEFAARQAQIVGTWSMEALTDEILPNLTIIFEESGKLTIFEEGEEKDGATWRLSEDGLYLVVIPSSDEEEPYEEKSKIVSVDEEHFIILDKRTKIKLVSQ